MKFDKIAHRVSIAVGHSWVFALAALLILLWLPSYFLFKDSGAWQLPINTTTTIVTFLMVFLLQNTQNRDSLAIHAKLDALIRASDASDELREVEEATEEEIAEVRSRN